MSSLYKKIKYVAAAGLVALALGCCKIEERSINNKEKPKILIRRRPCERCFYKRKAESINNKEKAETSRIYINNKELELPLEWYLLNESK